MVGVRITHFANELRHHDMAKHLQNLDGASMVHGAQPTHLGSFHAHAIPNTLCIELQSGPTTKL